MYLSRKLVEGQVTSPEASCIPDVEYGNCDIELISFETEIILERI